MDIDSLFDQEAKRRFGGRPTASMDQSEPSADIDSIFSAEVQRRKNTAPQPGPKISSPESITAAAFKGHPLFDPEMVRKEHETIKKNVSLPGRLENLEKRPDFKTASALKKPQMIKDSIQAYTDDVADAHDLSILIKDMGEPQFYKNLAKAGGAAIGEGLYRTVRNIMPIGDDPKNIYNLWDARRDKNIKYLQDVQKDALKESPSIGVSPFALPRSIKRTLSEGGGADPSTLDKVGEILRGGTLGAAEFVEGLTTPVTAAPLAVAAVAKGPLAPLGATAGLSFIPGMMEGTVEGTKRTAKNISSGKYGEAAREGVGAVGGALVTKGLVKGTLGNKVLADKPQAPFKESEIGAIGDISKLKEEHAQMQEVRSGQKKTWKSLTKEAKRKDLSIEDVAASRGIPPEQLDILRKQFTFPQVGGTGFVTGKSVIRPFDKLKKFDAPPEVQKIIQDVITENREFSGQRVKKANEDIKKLAKQLNLNEAEILNAPPGSIVNSETAVRVRMEIANQAKTLQESLSKVDTATANPVQLQKIKDDYLRLTGLTKAFMGFRTEASNLLRQFGAKVAPGEVDSMRNLAIDLKKAGIESGGDLDLFAQKVKQLSEPTKWDKAWHLWYSSILSGPVTHVKNILGNATNLVMEIGRSALTQPQEFVPAMRGMLKGLVEGSRGTVDIMKRGQPSKFEERGLKPVRFEGWAKPLNVFDYVGRSLASADEFFRKGAMGMEAGALARKQKGKFAENYKNNMELPEVMTYGEYATFNQKPAGVIGAISAGIANMTRSAPVLRPIAPFTRVVANVVNNGLDWTPVGLLRAARPVAKEGGYKFTPDFEYLSSGRARFQELGRGALGTIAMASLAGMATDGSLSGPGPDDYNKRQQLESTGWKPYAVRIGDTWYPYQNFGNAAIPLAIVGTYFDLSRYSKIGEKDLASRLSAATLSSVKFILDHSFLSGISDLMEAAANPTGRGAKYGPRFLAQQLGSVVPNFFKQIQRMFDPSMYDPQDIGEMIQSSTGFKTGLRKKINVWGEEIKGDRFSGLGPRKMKHDKVKDFLVEKSIYISMPDKHTMIEDQDSGLQREMTSDEYYDYIKLSGPQIYEAVTDLKDEFQYEEDVEIIKDAVNKEVSRIRKNVREDIAAGFTK